MKEVFLSLARLGIGHQSGFIPKIKDWGEIETLADRQGLSAIVLDGIDKLNTGQSSSTNNLPLELKLEWIGNVLQNYEARYADYRKRVGELAGFYNQHGYRLMVLKGYGLNLNYPKPSHRPCGDIDIYAFGNYKEADAAISKELGIPIDNNHHHHTVFDWKGYMVENHYDFVNIHYGHKNAELEKVFKELAKDDSHFVEIDGERVYLPSPNLHALFLLRHCMQDFASAEMNLRQVLDWGFFVEKHTSKIDWKWLDEVLRIFKMKDFFNCLNAICVGDLGFDIKSFPTVQFDPFIKDRVLNDILSPEFGRVEPRGFIKRICFKYRRWKGNAWKQELCYGDNRMTSLIMGIWNHLLKPKTI